MLVFALETFTKTITMYSPTANPDWNIFDND